MAMEPSSIDVLVLTPLAEELKALRAELGQPDIEDADNNFAYVSWQHVELKGRTNGCVVAVIPPDKDQLPAGNATHLALATWSPRCFALMGIAGKINNKVKLGDVVVARHVIQWDAKRKEQARPYSKARASYSITPIPIGGWGPNISNLLKSNDEKYKRWVEHCIRDRPPEAEQSFPTLHVEDIASGSATIDSEEMVRMLSHLSRHLYAVETEAAAALTAFSSRAPGIAPIVIRGISDPSTNKSQSDAIGEGAWRNYAASNAAKLLVCLLRSYPIPRQRNAKFQVDPLGSAAAGQVINRRLPKGTPTHQSPHAPEDDDLAKPMLQDLRHWEQGQVAPQVLPRNDQAKPLPPQPYWVHPYALQNNFTGRARQRKMLTKWLTRSSEPIFALIDIGGMGKSALTWVWLHHDVLGSPLPGTPLDNPQIVEACRVPERMRPAGIFWWSFYERQASFAAFVKDALVYASGASVHLNDVPSIPEQVRTLVTLLQQKRLLIVLDGFERELRAYASLSAAYQGDVVIEDERGEHRSCTRVCLQSLYHA
jgi:nucleoside phosphorylase